MRDLHGSRGTSEAGRACCRPASLQHGPHDGDDARRERQRDQRAAPASEKARERHRDRGGKGRTDLDPGRVDARPRRRPVGHGLPHGERRERRCRCPSRCPRPRSGARRARRSGRPHGADRRRRSARARWSLPCACRAGPRDKRRPGRRAPCRGRGSFPSSPTRACDASRSSWISSINGPTPTICGRSASAARNSPESAAPVDRDFSGPRPLRASRDCGRCARTPRRACAPRVPRALASGHGSPRGSERASPRPPAARRTSRRARS